MSQEPGTLVKDLHAIVFALTLSQRNEHKEAIKRLQHMLGDTTNFIVDGRGKHWKDYKNRIKFEAVFSNNTSKLCSMNDLSEITGLSISTIRSKLSGNTEVLFRDKFGGHTEVRKL